MKKYIQFSVFIFSVFLTTLISAQTQPKGFEKIKWYTIEEAEALSKNEKRKLFIDVYTTWCGWCKNMEKETFSQPYIAEYINANFYPVKLNAEQRNNIPFKGKNYKFVNNGQRGYNELAAELLKGQMGYPTVVFLDESLNLIQAIPGYHAPAQFEMIMTYFGQDNHKKMPWSKYEKSYIPMKR